MTAEKLFKNWFEGLNYDNITSDKIEKYAILFAKMKCQELLLLVAEKAQVRDVQTFEIKDPHDLRCDHRLEIYKSSILKSVNLEELIN